MFNIPYHLAQKYHANKVEGPLLCPVSLYEEPCQCHSVVTVDSFFLNSSLRRVFLANSIRCLLRKHFIDKKNRPKSNRHNMCIDTKKYLPTIDKVQETHTTNPLSWFYDYSSYKTLYRRNYK